MQFTGIKHTPVSYIGAGGRAQSKILIFRGLTTIKK